MVYEKFLENCLEKFKKSEKNEVFTNFSIQFLDILGFCCKNNSNFKIRSFFIKNKVI